MNKLLDGNHRFVRRCTAALTHPVTIGALGLLLLNDLLFKSLWSNPWTTGKLSDLTWVIFASPLLAFLLSPVARKSPLAERMAFVTAYVVLPILYAAFNTFPVVHDAILWALSFAGGTGPGAPHDPTDSLVIPFGLAITFWVWRREPPETNSLRMRFGLLTAGIAALASVATSPPERDFGVTAVEVAPNGTIVATWVGSANRSVETPTGTYTIEGPYIMRTHNGQRTVAYSAAYLQERGNIILQSQATRNFGTRKITTTPYSIIYDESSGNVIAAMGLQGAVVGTPDGQWTRVAVGRYVPTNFSTVARLLLLRDWRLWLAALALTFSFTGLAMTLAEAGSYSMTRVLVAVIGTLGAVLASVAIPFLGFVSIPLMVIVAFAIIASTFFSSTKPWRKTGHVILAAFAVTVSLGGMLFYGASGVNEYDYTTMLSESLSVFGSGLGLVLALLAVMVSLKDMLWRLSVSTSTASTNSTVAKNRKELLLAIDLSLVVMLILISLSLLLWVLMGIDLLVAKFSAIALVALTAIILRSHLGSKQPSSSQ